MAITSRRVLTLVVCTLTCATWAFAQGGVTGTKPGKGGSVVQGQAGTEGGSGDNGLEHCDKPMGALAVVEPQQQTIVALSRYNLQSPVSLIRLMVQQSNCFLVVERGVGMQNMIREFLRDAARSQVAIVYYAGHGVQIDGRNYLVPVDAQLMPGGRLTYTMMDMGTIIAGLDDQLPDDSSGQEGLQRAARSHPGDEPER